mgnify:CR=1 FL=1
MPSNIPMYVFTGFLESGKTKFIQETLEDERFNAGEKTLLLVFEEGEEEYDISTYPSQNVYIETPSYEELSEEFLENLRKKHHAERVIVELNGMHQAADFYLYHGVGPILNAISISPAEPAQQQVATF